MPSPCSPDRRTGSPSPRLKASKNPTSPEFPSALFATNTTRADFLRKISPNTRSAGKTPARASIMKIQTSAISTARSVNMRIRPCKLSSVASSNPAVSITVNFIGPIFASPSRKSRVTPG